MGTWYIQEEVWTWTWYWSFIYHHSQHCTLWTARLFLFKRQSCNLWHQVGIAWELVLCWIYHMFFFGGGGVCENEDVLLEIVLLQMSHPVRFLFLEYHEKTAISIHFNHGGIYISQRLKFCSCLHIYRYRLYDVYIYISVFGPASWLWNSDTWLDLLGDAGCFDKHVSVLCLYLR